MKPAGLALSLALISMAFAGCSHGLSRKAAEEGVLIEAEGWTPLDSQKPLETKQRALAEAQKQAVEKVTGVAVSASTKVESAVTLEQKISANIGGYIRSYEILSEREEEGFLKTRIRALVLHRPPKPVAAQAGLIRVAVLCDNENLSKILRASFAEQGFSLKQDAAEADYVVSGNVSDYALAAAGFGGFHSHRARVSLDVTRQKTQETLRQTQESSALDSVAELARDKAVDTAAHLAAEALAKRLKESPDSPGEPSSSDRP